MVDKSRKTGRPAGPKAGFSHGARPGERPAKAAGRNAGKPARGPARPRTVGGVDVFALERLEKEGMLTKEGQRLRHEAGGGPARGARQERPRGPRPEPFGERAERGARPERGQGPRPEPFGERTERGPRPERGQGPRPERGQGPRPASRGATFGGRKPGFGTQPGGFESVDEQLARSMTRGGPRAYGRGSGRRYEEEPGLAENPRQAGKGRPTARPTAKPGQRLTPRLAAKPAAARGPRKLDFAESEVAERLHKVMARAGVASRRHSEELIQAGRVTVNGQVVTELGMKVVAGKDLVEVDGRPLGKPENFIYLVLNKPKGYVTTLYDPQGRQKVTDLLGEEIAQRVYPVGRLDYDTEGLLMLTNDGDLANALMHPARSVKKTYIAKVRGVPGPAKLRALETGLELEDGMTAPADVKMLEVKPPNAATVSIRIHEGRNRQVRRMFEAIGHEVIHLKRTTLGPLHLKDLVVGKWRELTADEVKNLYAAAGLRLGGRPPRSKK